MRGALRRGSGPPSEGVDGAGSSTLAETGFAREWVGGPVRGGVVVGYLKVEKCKEVQLFSSFVLWQAPRTAGGM